MSGEAGSEPSTPAPGYPPERHVARDLRLWIERGAEGSRAGLPVVPELLGEHGRLRAGVLATLVDVAGGEFAVRALRPRRTATADLVLSLIRPVSAGSVEAVPALLRRSRSRLVLEVELRDAQGREVGIATLGFAILAEAGPVLRMGAGLDEPRTDFAGPGSGLSRPLPEALGLRCLDAAAGAFALPLTPYVGNSFGALQGGVVGMLVDLAAEGAAREALGSPCATTDLTIHYLSLGRVGPVRSCARLLRRDAAGALLRVELRDGDAEPRLMAVASAFCACLA